MRSLSVESDEAVPSKCYSNNSGPSSEISTEISDRVPPYSSENVAHNQHNFNFIDTSKSRVPDLLMINKFYGLIPQKFAISTRKVCTNSTSPSASSSSTSKRTTKVISAQKPRAKSSTHHNYHNGNNNRQERKSTNEFKGHRSDSDSPEPIKVVFMSRRGSTESEKSIVDKSSDPIGLVTKKMSVEKYKKWKNNVGGKGRNLNLQSFGGKNIGQTLSLLHNGLPDGLNSHARKHGASAECLTNRRVIKIDLNRVSREEENYPVTTRSQEDTASIAENKGLNTKVVNATHDTEFTLSRDNNNTCSKSSVRDSSEESSPVSPSASCSFDNGNSTYFVNNDDWRTPLFKRHAELNPPATFIQNEQAFHNAYTHDFMPPSKESTTASSTFPVETPLTSSENVSGREGGVSTDSVNDKLQEKQQTLVDAASMHAEDGVEKNVKDEDSNRNCRRLSSRTISFDGKILDACGASNGSGPTEGGSITKADATAKRRPMTTSGIRSVASCPFSTPNNFNPPSKVIPWTQQKAAGGQPLTLAERRAKFQRAPSIHSSSSFSMETGEEELLLSEETETTNSVRVPTTAFRESRKPLYVMQPPEIPTMISQINPNADEDIQIEIEKVALMLRKMQSLRHFSTSLDSGIETEILQVGASLDSSSNSSTSGIKAAQSTGALRKAADTDTVLLEAEELKSCGSETSVASTSSESDSASSDDPTHPVNNANNVLPPKSESLKNKTESTIPRPRKASSVPDGSINPQRITNSTNNGNEVNVTNITNRFSGSSAEKSLPATAAVTSPNNSTTSRTSTALRRPPLKKAVSISCEQELLKAGGCHRQNEVNHNANDNVKHPRPKTASGLQNPRNCGTGTRSTHNYNYRQNTLSSTVENQNSSINSSTSNGSQGSRNRKILIKKALMEINQTSANIRKKWGTLGRPRTAPSLDKNGVHQSTLPQQQHPLSTQRRKPLKASPFPISGIGKGERSSSGKSSSPGGGKSNGDSGNMENNGNSGGAITQYGVESSDEIRDKLQQNIQHPSTPSKGRSMFRQCFSLDESALLGFSIKTVNDGKIPVFETIADGSGDVTSSSLMLNDEISFLSSKKRQQCLRVYEKMLKTGCVIKMETILRGMLTPSEYRAFMREAEKATQETEQSDSNNQTSQQVKDLDDNKTNLLNVNLSEITATRGLRNEC